MLKEYQDVARSRHWDEFTKYDCQARAVLAVDPAGVNNYSGHMEAYYDLVNDEGGNAEYISDDVGRLTVYKYADLTTATASAAGDVAGLLEWVAIEHGEMATPILQSQTKFKIRTVDGINLFFPVKSCVYTGENNPLTFDPDRDTYVGEECTTLAYTWVADTAMPASIVTTLPIVSTGKNGSGTATTMEMRYDGFGRPIWSKDQDGFLTYTEYDTLTGAVVKRIVDVNTSSTGDFTGLPSGWTTPSGGGLHLITLYQLDKLGRVIKTTAPNGRIDYTVYRDALHEVRSYPAWDGSGPTGPTLISRVDRALGYSESISISATPAVVIISGEKIPTGTESIANIESLSRSHRNIVGQTISSEAYFDVTGLTYSTAAALGTLNTNYFQTSYAYGLHAGGLENKVVSPAGTITRMEYDGRGRIVGEWVGTDDTPTTGVWAVDNTAGTDMVMVRSYQYDGDNVGDDNLTAVIEYPNGSTNPRETDTAYDWRNRAVAVKNGVESSESTSLNRMIAFTVYDNLDRAIKQQMYDGDGVDPGTDAPDAGLLRAETRTSFDELDRAYKTQTFGVNPTSGTLSTNALTTQTWFDNRGEVVKTSQPGGLVQKTKYDGAGRVAASYTTDGNGGDSSYADALTVTGDTVYEQSEPTYDASGNVLKMVTRQRFHDAGGTGDLGTPTSGVGARVSYAGYYYDLADRPITSIDIGTNGGSAWTRPGSAPARSDAVLRTDTSYDSAGRTYEVTDPLNRTTRTTYDTLGRTLKTVENYVDGVVGSDNDKTTEYTYGPAGMTTLKAWTDSTHSQTTQWNYGVSGSANGVVSNDVVSETRWPDPTTGAASSTLKDVVTVNALGQTVTSTDRNGSVHTLSYDVLGRVSSDAVTTLGSGVDGSVRRIETSYDSQGNAYLVTGYSAASGGSVVNQVQRTYNGLGQLTAEYQANGGAVDVSTTPKVQYGYSNLSGNRLRLQTMTYPNGKVLYYNYSGGLDPSDLSRLDSISDSTGTLESYEYLGLGTVVSRNHPVVNLSYITSSSGDAGDQYGGLDRFGRVVDQDWKNGSTVLDWHQYTYDRDGNRLTKSDGVSSGFGETYTYDGLNQIASYAQGSTHMQSWSYDGLGNWSSNTIDGGTAQTRGHNAQNEITSVSGATTPTYDANGNMTTDETGKTYTYDAWNRMESATSGSITVTYSYDGLSRRITETVGSNTTHLYYSAGWQVLEERLNSSTTASIKYVCSPVYIDTMILRDRDTDANGTLDERLWPVQDANFNITALINNSGAVVEKFTYDAFGLAVVRDASYGVKSGGSDYAWLYRFQGGRWSSVSGLVSFRFREYSVTLGRWMTNDPLQYISGDTNIYRSKSNHTVNDVDPYGLQGRSDLQDTRQYILDKKRKEKQAMEDAERHNKEAIAKTIRENKPPVPGAIVWNNAWLLKCPKTLEELLNLDKNEAYKNKITIRKDPDWVTSFYHEGASSTYRLIINGQYSDNQCGYDCKGKLITSGTGAGTADKSLDLHEHWNTDVMPWFTMNIDDYHKQNPPISADDAPANRVDGPVYHTPSGITTLGGEEVKNVPSDTSKSPSKR